MLAREREAAIKQFVTALSEQQMQTRTLVRELRQTLEAGTAASDSINAAIRSLDSLMARFQALKARPEPALFQGKPFNIAEYSTAAREFAATTRELEGLLRTLDSGAPGVVTLANGVFANAKSLTDYIFWRVAALLTLSVALLFAAAVGYRIVMARAEPRAKL